ncbi:GH92 family glycosyl hydrolase [Solilutibacter silvestris]|uniref:GH92 family glycosyl hydrolase n=1 Tax=Solilutibacter silvestris TaxID=1645665 RepID=UPI003D357E81
MAMRARTLSVFILAALAAHAGAQSRPAPAFASSFESNDPQPLLKTDGGIALAIGNGPEAPYNAKAKAGYSGLHALRYQGRGAGGRTRLFAVDIPVDADTALSWLVLPEITGGIVDGDTVASTGIGIDLVFDDGRRLSQLDARDQHGAGITAAGQAASKTLYPQQWARKQVRVGDIASLRGHRIHAIELELQPVGGATAQGWIDDIAITSSPRVVSTRPSDDVLTTRGTQSNGTFSRGNNFPATALPHGFNFWTPVTDAGTLGWLYRWNEGNDGDNHPRLQALALSHEPSPWMGDRQTFQVMPSLATGEPEADRKKRALSFRHDDEIARPYLYGVHFDNGIAAEIAPTDHAALFRFRFPANDGKSGSTLLFDNVDARGGLTLDSATQTLSGYTDTRSGLSNGAGRMYVYARFDQPWQGSGTIKTGRPTGYVNFTVGADREVRMRIATSLISVEQAKHNLELEIGNATFDAIRDRGQAAWDAVLGRVHIAGASDDQRTTTYSNLYRLFLYPNSAHENTGSSAQPRWMHADQSSWAKDNAGGDAQRTSARILPGKLYVNNGFWDTYRTAWPAYALIAPKQAGEMVDGFLQQYRDGGWVARWSSPGYADLMVGTSSDVAFADAWLKGVRGFDPREAYAAALRNATTIAPAPNVGRKGMAASPYRGYIDTGVGEGLSWSLEGGPNDFGIAQLAEALAKTSRNPREARRYNDEAAYFRGRALDYAHLFDPATGFFRGREANGGWQKPANAFDPRVWGGDYTEGNAWTYAFPAVYDSHGLAALYGGRDGLAKKLDALFSTPETAGKEFSGSYGEVIHEMTEARDVRLGMYAHSNQPSHHLAWLYDSVGQPWKTQALTREIQRRLYLGSEIGQGYPGDEDNGEMSAWYVFAMLGLYPLRMGAPEYAIGSPAFDRVDVTMDNGRTLHVIARGNSLQNVYVQSLKVNGKPWTKAWLPHAAIANGGTLEFTMGPKPSRWGSGERDLAPSLTNAGQAPKPLCDLASQLASSTFANGASAKALVDGDAMIGAAIAGENRDVRLRFDQPQKIDFYTLTTGEHADTLTLGWTLQGRNDAGTWHDIDHRTGETFPWSRQLRPFRITHPQAWRELRLRFDGSAQFDLGEVGLMQARRFDVACSK